MASVESIGACSLDFEASAAENYFMKDLTASECTLHSNGLTPSIKESSRNGNVDHDMRASEVSQYTNGVKSSDKKEYSVAEIKLPSYVSISCAINGYTNYSRFCRSRDNSPARSSFRKSSLEPSMLAEVNGKESSQEMHTCRYSRSQSDCNGTMHSVYTESKRITVSKQLQIPLKSTKKYSTELTITNGNDGTSVERTASNSASVVSSENENLALAKEVGNGGTKSLVQQRIESLYGKSVCDEIKVKHSSKIRERITNGSDTSVLNSKEKAHKGSVSPPVFKHLNEDFRKQLQANTADIKSENRKVLLKSNKKIPEKQSQGHHENISLPYISNGIGHDECDRAISKTPPPKLSDVALETDKNFKELPETERDGYKYLNLVDIEKENIQTQVKKLEQELLENPSIPEEASGKIRAACGKANLLMSQKFEQFRSLCWKNIEENPSVPFYTTASDLAGFWDLVMLQVDDINSTFKEIEIMRKNDWKEVMFNKPVLAEMKPRSSNSCAVVRSNPNTPKRTAKSSELAKAREEARRQLLAAKKKGRQQNTSSEDDIAIFTPASS